MSSVLYPKAKEALLKANLDLDSTVKVLMVDTSTGGYSYDPADEFLSDVAAPARIATSSALSGKAMTDGHFSSDPASFTGVSGLTVEAIIGFQDTGVAGTSRLIWYQDSDVDGLPATPDGGNISVTPDNSDGIWWDL